MVKVLKQSNDERLKNLCEFMQANDIPYKRGIIVSCDKNLRLDDVENLIENSELSNWDRATLASFNKAVLDEKIFIKNDKDFCANLFEAFKKMLSKLQSDKSVFLKKVYNDNVVIDELILTCEEENCKTGRVYSRDEKNNFQSIKGYVFENGGKTDIFKINEKIRKKLEFFAKKLEKHCKSAVILDFFIENDEIFIDSVKVQNFSKKEKIKLFIKLVEEKIISKIDAVKQVEIEDVEACLHSYIDENVAGKKVIAKGLCASSGAVCGKIFFSTDTIKKIAYPNSILVCEEVSPKDVKGVKNLKGVIACHGGNTSHGAVVLRTLGVPGVIGCQQIKIDGNSFSCNSSVYHEGDIVTLDANNGTIYDGEMKVSSSQDDEDFIKLLLWAKSISKIDVYANADSPKQAKIARKFGANGIGVCRTEHMFFDADRICTFRQMIMASTQDDRKKALDELLPMQRDDFEGIFKEMDGLVVTIRLLDPPLHEFLPKNETEIKEFSQKKGASIFDIEQKISELKEFNPMMGHRGVRLFITYPEIAIMQTRAIIEGAINAQKQGAKVYPEIMIPLTSDLKEFCFVKSVIKNEAEKILNENHAHVKYKIGTMMEIPRACLLADEIAKEAEFFSFGTNDLTQMTFGFSRDDSGKYLKDYLSKDILPFNPFERIDEKGVGKFMKMAVQKGRSVRNNLTIGVCGEQGAEENSIKFCKDCDIDYVSCSPFRVPMALISSAKLTLTSEE